MSGDRGGYVIGVDQLPGGVNAARFDGHVHGASVSFFITRSRPGTGPRLHRHPYEETFIVQEGRVRFTVGVEEIECGPGEIVVAPAGTAHKFVNVGDKVLRQVNIHPVPRMQTEWLE